MAKRLSAFERKYNLMEHHRRASPAPRVQPQTEGQIHRFQAERVRNILDEHAIVWRLSKYPAKEHQRTRSEVARQPMDGNQRVPAIRGLALRRPHMHLVSGRRETMSDVSRVIADSTELGRIFAGDQVPDRRSLLLDSDPGLTATTSE
jgi:hypothetical protein